MINGGSLRGRRCMIEEHAWRYLCQKHSLPFIARREQRAMKNDENDAHSIETKIVIRNETRVVNASR